MAKSQNGYPVLESPSDCVKWIIPMKKGSPKHFVLKPGPAGYVLAHFALFFHESVEPLNTQAKWDDWGYAKRPVRGARMTYSNHSSGTAIDCNATEHPLGSVGSFTDKQEKLIHDRIRNLMRGLIRWGGDYKGRKDEMHFEIVGDSKAVASLAKRLQKTPRGIRISKANPHYKKL